jgi:hypothetical protein
MSRKYLHLKHSATWSSNQGGVDWAGTMRKTIRDKYSSSIAGDIVPLGAGENAFVSGMVIVLAILLHPE